MIWKGTGPGWTVAPAPAPAMARAVRLSFDYGGDELAELDLADPPANGALDLDLRGNDAPAPEKRKAWKGELEGMKILRRRYTNLFPTCKVSVSSGHVTPDGEWDAQRERPLMRADPAIYMLSWEAVQPIRGLAIKEIDGRFTEIDAWTGEGEPALAGKRGWEKVATYEQRTRYYYAPDQNFNAYARYMDGYVDFGREVRTRALRLRIVEQWMWKEEDRAGCAGVRFDRGGEKLEPARCRVYGVAPLQYLGGETPLEDLMAERLEVYDVTKRQLVKELPLDRGGDLACAPDGTLYAVSAGRVVKVDPEQGRHVPVRIEVERPGAIACDRAGNLFVHDAAADQNVVKVFDPAGSLVRRIGNPAPREAGPHDPTRLLNVSDIAVDEQDQVWMVESVWVPKRITLWGEDGTFKREFLGNTSYGGGGSLNPYDKRSLFYGPLEFELEWQTGRTRLKNITWLGDSAPGERAIKVQDRLYVVTRQEFAGLRAEQAVGVVYLYEKDHLRRVAAAGAAGKFPPLRTPEILEKLGKKAIGYFQFAWSDLNGDERAQVDEVQFFDTNKPRGGGVGRFDDDLGLDAGDYRYDVERYLPNGVPIYARTKKRFSGSSVRIADGRNFLIWNHAYMGGVTEDGKPAWTHPTEQWGVHGLTGAKPWFAGQTVAQFGVIGHETSPGGDLGEFFVTHGACGTWHIWTADGLLAGRIFRDMCGPGARPWSMREHERGLDLSAVTVGQEHWAGFFCRTREDNKFYAVAGHNHVSVVEGLEQFKRVGGEIKVREEDLAAAMQWDRRRQARRLYEAAKLLECRRVSGAVSIDGSPDEWESPNAVLEDREVSFSMAYDDANLYVCYVAQGCGPMKNTGNDWRRLFKTGAAADLLIGVDPQARPDRNAPAPGDLRVLLTVAEGKPVAVLYQPVAPDARPDEAWEARTMVFQAKFARVARLAGAAVAARSMPNGYCLEASIPLAAVGLEVRPDLMLKMDWGILVSGPDGNEVMQRLYWANPQTGIVADEAAEAMLRPDLWGTVRFSDRTSPKGQPELKIEQGVEHKSEMDVPDDLNLDE